MKTQGTFSKKLKEAGQPFSAENWMWQFGGGLWLPLLGLLIVLLVIARELMSGCISDFALPFLSGATWQTIGMVAGYALLSEVCMRMWVADRSWARIVSFIATALFIGWCTQQVLVGIIALVAMLAAMNFRNDMMRTNALAIMGVILSGMMVLLVVKCPMRLYYLLVPLQMSFQLVLTHVALRRGLWWSIGLHVAVSTILALLVVLLAG